MIDCCVWYLFTVYILHLQVRISFGVVSEQIVQGALSVPLRVHFMWSYMNPDQEGAWIQSSLDPIKQHKQS